MPYSNPTFSFLVSDLPEAVRFYQEAFNFQVQSVSDDCAVMAYQGVYYLLSTQAYAEEQMGYAPNSSACGATGITPVLWSSDVESVIEQAGNAGGQFLGQSGQGTTLIASINDISGYTWHIRHAANQEALFGANLDQAADEAIDT